MWVQISKSFDRILVENGHRTYLKEAEVLAGGDGDGELRLGPPGAQAAGAGGALVLSRAHPNPPGLPLPVVPLETQPYGAPRVDGLPY